MITWRQWKAKCFEVLRTAVGSTLIATFPDIPGACGVLPLRSTQNQVLVKPLSSHAIQNVVWSVQRNSGENGDQLDACRLVWYERSEIGEVHNQASSIRYCLFYHGEPW